jgi:hypothetical protein
MQPDPTKAKFDPIPVLPPGIAPPDARPTPSASESKPVPKPSEPAATKPSAPPSPSQAAPATPGRAVPSWLKGVFAPTKNKGIVAAAAASLLVGWYGVRTVFPPTPKSSDVARSGPETPPLPDVTTTTPEIPPATTPVAAAPTGFLPPISVPAVDLTNPAPGATTPSVPDTATPAAAPPVVVPLVHLDTSATAPKPVPFTVPTVGTPEIKPASFDDVKTPPAPTVPVPTPAAGGSPMPPIVLPDVGGPVVPSPAVGLPVVPGVTPPAVAEKPKEKPAEVPPPAIPSVELSGLGSTTPSPAPVTVPPAATPVVTVPPAATPAPATTPTMTVPTLPPAAAPKPAATDPGGSGLVSPDLTFSKPAAPAPVVSAPAPSVTPASPPLPPAYTPPAAATPTPTPSVLPVSGGTPAPAPPAVETKTDFDVDLHYPKPGETYASISKLHYGDERYARVLEQFNAAAGTTGRVVQVPPTWWVKKQTGAPVSRPAPTPTKGDEWSAAPASSVREYVVPASKIGGMTFRDIATEVYGSDQEWQRVFDLNPRYAADAVLPAGTKVRVTGNP